MSSFQITLTPSQRAAGRFVSKVRREIQKALAEEAGKHGTTQSDLARSLGVNRSVISREIRGHKDLTLGRVGELAWALGRVPSFELLKGTVTIGPNLPVSIGLIPQEQLGLVLVTNLKGEVPHMVGAVS